MNYYYGSDYSIINAARVSFNRDLASLSPIKDAEKDKKLLNFLYEQGHYSVFEHVWFYIHKDNFSSIFEERHFNPEFQIYKCDEYYIFSGRTLRTIFSFLSENTLLEIKEKFPGIYSVYNNRYPEKLSDKNYELNIIKTDSGIVGLVDYFIFEPCPKYSIFTFIIETPIFVARQWMRHRWGSYNELSRRYTKSDIRFYIPNYNIIDENSLDEELKDELIKFNYYAENLYKKLLEKGVSKEIARLVLPLSTYTRFYWTVFKGSLDNFIRLRTTKEAQYEIRVLASNINRLVKDIYKF